MNQPNDAIAPPDSNIATEDHVERWPACTAFLVAWCRPATCARRLALLPLARAYAVHLVAAILVAHLIVFFIAIAEHPGPLLSFSVRAPFAEALEDIATNFVRRPREATFAMVANAIFFELAFLGVALLVTPWGAKVEPLRASFVNALRCTWLQTAHIVVVVLLVGAFASALSRMETNWRAKYRFSEPQLPEALMNTTQGSQPWPERPEPLVEHQSRWRAWKQGVDETQPWYFRHVEILITHACLIAVFWLMWALLRAVGAPRRAPPVERPPTCEACGYNLTGIPLESRCPECGEPVVDSLGPDARPGTDWDRRRDVGAFAAWWRCAVGSCRQPRVFGRQIRVHSPGAAHRWFLAVHMPLAFVVTAFGVVGFAAVNSGVTDVMKRPTIIFIVAPIMGTLGTLGTLGLTLLAAGLVGLWYRVQDKRNLLPGSMQVASYLVGFLTLWVAFGWMTGAIIEALEEAMWFRGAEKALGLFRGSLAFFAWLLPNVVWVVGYFGLVAKGTAGLRYANR